MTDLALAIPDAFIEEVVARVAATLENHDSSRHSDSPYLTTDEARQWLRCSRQRIHDLLTQGRLSRYKEGRRTLVLRSEVEALVELDRARRLGS